MTPLLFGISGLINAAKKQFNNPLAENRDWSDYESPAFARRSGVSLEQWYKAQFNDNPPQRYRLRGSLDQLI
ncbi:hypothetical protein BN1049_01280 [Pseudomonas saudimassiliensis]|uniref:Uncharacterized protein n=1 Tax=Pseudomonas saudimassiliensis TaxID=1461581 RepID=A0A078MCK2_9PSED|nr:MULTISPECIES: hypothetical protein [Pseudomonadaceae]CEA03929.1 hypothetical protein BN1049_01280 [Pseudomonas saudimassiliensis]CEF26351.1 hypothetical protein BN1049_01280 [Pseudomonas saudimassiliensis]